MGFLDHWRNQSNDTQGDLFQQEGSGVIDASEPNRSLVNRRLHGEIKQRGGQNRTHAAVNRLANEHMTGETTEDLYQGLGLKQGDRSKLPTAAKEALMTGDIAAYHQIMEDDAQGHHPIVNSARQGYQKASRLFPWNKQG
jgi:hypothetical protein